MRYAREVMLTCDNNFAKENMLDWEGVKPEKFSGVAQPHIPLTPYPHTPYLIRPQKGKLWVSLSICGRRTVTIWFNKFLIIWEIYEYKVYTVHENGI